MRHRSCFSLFAGLALVFCLAVGTAAAGPVQVDIYGPGQGSLNLAMAAPLGPTSGTPVSGMGVKLNGFINENLSFLPFLRLVDQRAILGGTVMQGYKSPDIDLKRFQLAGADLVVTAGWPQGDASGSFVELRVYEALSGKLVFGKAYSHVEDGLLPNVADRFCSDLMKALTGRGEFFKSTLAFVKHDGKNKRDVWLVKPVGRDLRKITNLPGEALSPSWSPDGRFVVFSHFDDRSHALGVWDRLTRQVQRIRFPGNTVIGPCFLPDNKVAVSLSSGRNPDIFLLNHLFKKERELEANPSINVSPSFDATGTKMAFTSSRMGGPQVFMKDMTTGQVTRISKTGSYNTEPSISPDGTLVAFTKMTDTGHRIFVYDMVTQSERQVSFGPGRDEQPSFAPDSYFLAFTSNRNGAQQIFLVTRHGGDPKRVPTGPGDASFARWGMIPE